MRFHAHVNASVKILNDYHGHFPFAGWLKDYFRKHKKYGSKDRKFVTTLCFGYFRLGKNIHDFTTEQAVTIGYALQVLEADELLQYYQPKFYDWLKLNPLAGIEDRLSFFQLSKDKIFSFQQQLSKAIDFECFSASHLLQPKVFLRVRPAAENQVAEKLSSIPEAVLTGRYTIELPPAFPVEEYFMIEKEVVVQDKNSQNTSGLFPQLPASPEIWDACAGSGGKSILAADYYPGCKLTVSDIRASILKNLKKRFQLAEIEPVHSFVVDLTRIKPANNSYRFIIADVPCTGSGTWGRSPEQLLYFSEEKIEEYSRKQQQLVENIVPSLQQNGYLLYITCSVFEKENEQVAQFIMKQLGLKLLEEKYFLGYNSRADSLYGALFVKK